MGYKNQTDNNGDNGNNWESPRVIPNSIHYWWYGNKILIKCRATNQGSSLCNLKVCYNKTRFMTSTNLHQPHHIKLPLSSLHLTKQGVKTWGMFKVKYKTEFAVVTFMWKWKLSSQLFLWIVIFLSKDIF